MEIMLFMNLSTPEIIMLLLVIGFPLILTVFCLIDIMRSNFPDQTNKLLWIIIVLLAPLIGAVIYLFWGRKQKAL